MSKLYKFGFWILLICTVTFFNFWDVTKNVCEKEIVKSKELNDSRIFSLMMSNIVDFRKIRFISGENIVTGEIKSNLFKEKALAILLSVPKCNKCQEKELRRLNEINEKMEEWGVHIIGLTTLGKINDVAIQRKLLKLDFPIYWVDDEIFYKEVSFANEYPQIIYVKDNILQTGFVPVPMDDEFSKIFYRMFLKNIDESCKYFGNTN